MKADLSALDHRYRARRTAQSIPSPATRAMLGQRYGRLAVIGFEDGSSLRVICRCDCGNEGPHDGYSVRSGRTASCGCIGKEILSRTLPQKRHGMSRSRVHRTWMKIIDRCTAGHRDAKNYADRGITVCERWRTFENFYADMGDPPEGTSIDRIDNDKGYEPGNCRWATDAVQRRNKRYNIYIEHDGRRMVVADWAAELGISRQTLYSRISRGTAVHPLSAPNATRSRK